jgi:hypothetical protein
MTIPTHVARRNRIGIGERVTVSLLAEAIHLMPRAERVSGRDRPDLSEAAQAAK